MEDARARSVLLYLCCGSGGGAEEFERAGFRVIGVDIKRHREWKWEFIEADIRTFDARTLPHVRAIFATTPCTEFSQCWSFTKTRTPRPAECLELFRHAQRIARECGVPAILENVRGAQPFIGRAAAHCGSFYLWGDVPALLPTTPYTKGAWSWKKGKRKVKHTRSPMLRARIPAELAAHLATYLYTLTECYA